MYIKDSSVFIYKPRRKKEEREELEILTLFVEDNLEDVRAIGILDGTVVRSEVFCLGLVDHEGVTQALGRNILRHLEPAFF